MDKEEMFEMNKKQIKYQMEELKKLRDLNMIEEYRHFKNVFIDSVSSINLKTNAKFNDFIVNFIIEEIYNFDKISNDIMENKRNKEGVLKEEYSKQYKYCQQIIRDYSRILRLDQ